MIERIIKKLRKKLLPDNREQLSAFLLHDLFHGRPFFPFTISSLSFHTLHSVVSDIVINNRKQILEFGAGISTVVIARTLKDHNVQGMLVSVEENEGWLEAVKRSIDKEGLSAYVKFVHAPLKKYSGIENCMFYDEAVLNAALGVIKFDSVLVDGPSAWNQETVNSRMPALNVVDGRLASAFSFFVDNSNRPGETKLVSNGVEKLKTVKIQLNETSVALLKGPYFNFYI
jgi:tRNA A58 N-methylase Trm61